MSRIVIAAFYHFAPVPDPAAWRTALLAVTGAAGLRGSILIAAEGINATVAGPRAGIDGLLSQIRGRPGFGTLTHKESFADSWPFGRMKVRLKREIVTMGQPDVDPRAGVGRYVDARDWNDLIARPDVAVIDTRNAYEVAIGTFAGAIDPGIGRFGDFPAWWQENRQRFDNKRIAMFCTGGIRCEKATSYLIGQGIAEVCHLKGGILKYLADVPEKDSQWHGACFVFDQRVSVEHGLRVGPHDMCHACRRPLLPADKTRPEYEAGVACHRCRDAFSETDRARFRERQRQIRLASARGAVHLGDRTVPIPRSSGNAEP